MNTLKLRDKIIFGVIILVVLIWFLHFINSVLSPFICAIIISYFLNPLVNKLEKHHLPRSTSTLIILGIFLLAINVGIILLLPILYTQFASLISVIPQYFHSFVNKLYPEIIAFLKPIGIKLNSDVTSYFNEKDITKLLSISNDVLGNIVQSGMNAINILSLIIVTPILVFYFLKDWNLLIKKINQYLPAPYAPAIQKIFKEINKTLSGYVKGQFNVCLILGILYAIGLSLSGLNFGFLIGFLTGLISFIPCVGMIIGAITAIIIGLFQWGFDINHFTIIAIIFAIGQIIDSNFLTPKLIGEKIGLHPIWIIFGLFIFATLFGFIGLLLAVPISAIAGVIIKFIGAEYLKYNEKNK